MRSFTDADGRRWQAALLDASYGEVLLVFSPAQGAGNRASPLAAGNLAEAMGEFAALDEAGLQRLLGQSEPYDPAAG
ncbi:MAG: hypothetical protein J0H15_11635 [Xanthomonadales bacterium]|nr:hypothetical protein [Xanthomonadales bacterium]